MDRDRTLAWSYVGAVGRAWTDGEALALRKGLDALAIRETAVAGVTPSTKYSWLASPPRLAKGRTTIERRGGVDLSCTGAGIGFATMIGRLRASRRG
jgi:hypothetical protein